MPTPAFRICDLEKTYGRQAVLKDVSFAVEPGESFALIGVNGAGKTTLIKCLLDFVAVDAGSVEIFGIDHRLVKSRASLVYLPEKFVAPYFLTGRDFLAYAAALHGFQVEAERLHVLLDVLDLAPGDLAKPVRQLSKGMSQKLGLLVCLLSDKPLYLLDEPMSGLDPKVRAYLKQHLQAEKSEGKTLFFSTHLLADVEALCDRIAILHDGGIRFLGSPEACCIEFACADLEQAYLACLQATTGKNQTRSDRQGGLSN